MNAAEEFALSLVSLALARNGFASEKSVRLRNGTHADLIATETDPLRGQRRFAVEVKAVSHESGVPASLENVLEEQSDRLGMETHVAYFVDSTDTLVVDSGLAEHMLFRDPDVALTTVSASERMRSVENAVPVR